MNISSFKIDTMLVPLISLIWHLFLPKIEIRLKYFLDKNFQKQPLWEKSEGSSWSQRASPRKATAARDQSFVRCFEGCFSGDEGESLGVHYVLIGPKSSKNCPKIVQKNSKENQKISKQLTTYLKFFLKQN